MQRLIRTCRGFIASTRGLAAIEFAMIAPVLVVMLLATLDGGRAIAAYMKLRAATYALAAITNQYSTIASTDMTSILGATSVVMAPYNTASVVVTISQVQINGSGVASIEWSAAQNGTPRSVGSAISPPAAMVVNGSYLILAEVKYTYTPLFGLFGAGGISMSDNLYVTPRSVACIVYTPQSNVC